MAWKIKNKSTDVRRVLDGGRWVNITPGKSIVVSNVDSYVKNHKAFEVTEVVDEDKKSKKIKG